MCTHDLRTVLSPIPAWQPSAHLRERRALARTAPIEPVVDSPMLALQPPSCLHGDCCAALRATLQRLRHEASHDALTDLCNRRGLIESEVLCDPDEATAVLFVDVDGLKEVNDRLGHRHGDELILAVSDVMRRMLRRGDVIARVGGDEFVIALANQTESTLHEVVMRVRQEFDGKHRVPGTSGIRASVGAALWRPGESAEDVIARADAAMYSHKFERSNGGSSTAAARDEASPAAASNPGSCPT